MFVIKKNVCDFIRQSVFDVTEDFLFALKRLWQLFLSTAQQIPWRYRFIGDVILIDPKRLGSIMHDVHTHVLALTQWDLEQSLVPNIDRFICDVALINPI